jgi:hypothetical protein
MGTPPLPRGYKKTSVLFLGWAEEEDDTEGYDEVRSCCRNSRDRRQFS